MISYKNLHIIGTSHISAESVNEVKRFINEKKPDIVALELDRPRFEALISNEKRKMSVFDIKEFGFNGFLFNLIGSWVQKKLGNLVGVSPGSEMIAAISAAKANKLQIALVDQDIRITLKRVSQLVTLKEKFRLFTDLIKGIFVKKIDGMDFSKMDLNKVPEEKLIRIMLRLVKKRYPSFYKSLIEERNIVISKNLNTLIENNKEKTILAVLGAGHLPGLMRIIKSG